MTPTMGGLQCQERGCTKNAGHASAHRIPLSLVKPSGRTLAQATGAVESCGVILDVKGSGDDVRRHRCRKPRGHASNHHDGARTWA